MSNTRQQYHREIAQNRAWFKDHAVEIYRNDSIVLMDVRGAFQAMERPWKSRPANHVRGLVVHHRASWNSYQDMQQNVVMPRYRSKPNSRHDRIAYTAGVDHSPDVIDGRVAVWLFNDLDCVSWHSGSKGKDTDQFTQWRQEQGPGNWANQYTIGLNLSGFFSSAGYPPNHPQAPTDRARKRGLAGTLICQPSREQCRAVWGLWQYICAVTSSDAPAIFGHIDTGKSACPGDVAMELVHAIRTGVISNTRELDRWLDGRDDRIFPGGWPTPAQVYGESHVAPAVDYVTECQRLLIANGYDLGRWGADGKWGRMSRIALIEFEEEHGLLVNGEPEKADYDALLALGGV